MIDVNAVSHPFFIRLHWENRREMLTAFLDAVGNICAAANVRFIGDFDMPNRANTAANHAITADGRAA